MSKEKRHTPSDENELLAGILKGDTDVLDSLYKTNFPTIARLIINNGGDIDDAKDIFQESIIILYEKVCSGSFALNSKLKTFLYSVSRNLWLKKLAKKGVYTRLDDFEERVLVEEDIEIHKERDKQFSMMEDALKKLGEPCRTIIEDFYIHNMNMQDISEKFGYTNTDNAKNQKYKCLQRLKKLYFG
ncbi:sigma-70 family RNA polymerase sigma factor [Olivibacter sp. CPCC 100613]|uniref:RNA polymerase sigma factor n=1 Tax=Olivibacter sp. CPCC 100613 TaxID=3079931 RepID=UPI002FFC38D8